MEVNWWMRVWVCGEDRLRRKWGEMVGKGKRVEWWGVRVGEEEVVCIVEVKFGDVQ